MYKCVSYLHSRLRVRVRVTLFPYSYKLTHDNCNCCHISTSVCYVMFPVHGIKVEGSSVDWLFLCAQLHMCLFNVCKLYF